jgi:hypothetical protein
MRTRADPMRIARAVRKGLMDFMGSTGGRLNGQLRFIDKVRANADSISVHYPIPNVGTGRVAGKPAGVSDAGADCGIKGTVTRDTSLVERVV